MIKAFLNHFPKHFNTNFVYHSIMVTKYLIMPSIRYVMYINPVEAYGIVDFPAHIVESSRVRAERATRRLISRLKSAGVKGLKTETQVYTTLDGAVVFVVIRNDTDVDATDIFVKSFGDWLKAMESRNA